MTVNDNKSYYEPLLPCEYQHCCDQGIKCLSCQHYKYRSNYVPIYPYYQNYPFYPQVTWTSNT